MPIDANLQSDWSTTGASSRQKRVLPSRSRRGGPGLGHCEVDNLILETQKRKSENEPLIPGDTPFLLTTNPKYAEEALNDSESGIQINVVANDRYFDRPDVLKAFREQAVIQTPEYEAISESISGVGGRFRPRNQEEAVAETSDAAYEKRHRKFENFEKRQRLREKEKLKHEHYKLKERIEQLRAMDGSTFMTLPPSVFTPPPRDMAEDVEETTNSPYVSLNGGMHIVEGERRRKEMLDVAIMLEKRYTYLLPPRKVPEVSSSALKDIENREDEETDTERDSGVPASKKDKASKPRTQSVKSSASSTPARSPASLRPLLLKKSWLIAPTLTPEPKRPNHRTSISTFAETPEITISFEEKEEPPAVVENDRLASEPLPPPRNERSSSPIITVDDTPETDRLPSQLSPTPTPMQSVRDEKWPSPHTVDDISEDDTLPSQPPPMQSVRDENSRSPQIIDVDDIPEDDRLPSQPPSPLLPPLVCNEKAPSPDIIMDDDVPENDELLSHSPPPPTFQSVPNDVGPLDVHSPEFPVEEQLPVTIQNGTQPEEEDVSMEISDECRSVDTDINVEVLQPQPEPLLNMAYDIQHMESPTPVDGGSEEVTSTAENVQVPKKGGRPPKKRVDTEEVEAKTAEMTESMSTGEPVSNGEPVSSGEPVSNGEPVSTAPLSIGEPVSIDEPATTGEPVLTVKRPRKKKRGWWKRKVFLPRETAAEQTEPVPEIRVKRRVLQQEDMAGPSRLMEDEPEVVSGIRIEEVPAEVGLTDSISTRPVKRRRRNGGVELDPESISAVPTVDSDKGISATSIFFRGKTHVSYVDSRTGEKVLTPSLLMVACMRAMGKTHSRRARETISFGVPTPDFGKGAIVDYELLEEILYRDFRDMSLDPSGSLGTSDEQEWSEQEDSDPSDDDAEEEPEDETEDETEENENETDEEHETADKEDETEDETGSVNRQSPEVQLSNERDKQIETERGSPEPLQAVEPQSGRDENHRGIKVTEQGHHSRNGDRFLIYQGPSDEQLIASPEAEPMPELPPGVRPREPSRRHNDWEEELIWD